MVGHFKESAGANRGPELDRLEREFGQQAAAWCAMFATKAVVKAGGSKQILTAAVKDIRAWAAAGTHGLEKGINDTPKVGDLAMRGTDHVGIVEAVKNGTVYTIEGNTSSGKVARRTNPISAYDYARPVYGVNSSLGGSSTGGGGSSSKVNEASWAVAVLNGLGIEPTPQAVKSLLGWEKAEGKGLGGKNNPLNTTQRMTGSTTFNSHGVQNYRTLAQGVEATIRTLTNGKYQPILSSFVSAVNASPWGTALILLR
jgi:hypothetical protein